MRRLPGLLLLALLGGCFLMPQKGWKSLDFKVYHLGTAGQPEWLEFAQDPPHGREVYIPFPDQINETEATLVLWQSNVKFAWTVSLNGKKLGQLPLFENPMLSVFPLAPGALKQGENILSVTPPKENEDILVGMVRIDRRSPREVLGEATLDIDVVEPIAGGGVPCRITIVDDALGALAPLAAPPGQRLALRPGCVYSADGRARVTLPAGRYRVFAGRGFEYSVAQERVTVGPRDTEKVSLKIRREVPTANLAACDTHIHTLTFSGHGDASDDERAITLAGEGIELPVATEHNQNNGYAAALERTGLRSRMTPVLGSEITTKKGHFNIFPVPPAGPVPDFRLADWPALMASIRAVPGVKIVILNHPRNRHDDFVPFADANFNRVTGDNRRGFDFTFDAMELINSSATRNDDTEVIHDWMALLNHGYRITGVGSSDSHEVNRFIVGQARTYVSCKDADPSRIDVAEACQSLLQGRAVVSYGLLAQIKVNGRAGPGDLVTDAGSDLDVELRISGPSWTRLERVQLYANGQRIRDEWFEGGAAGGEKARLHWKIGKPQNDVHLVAVATGPGVKELYWPQARPYQPATPVFNPQVIAVTNPVWIDADGDGVFTAPRALAAKVMALHGKDLAAAVAELGHYDEAVASQAAALLQESGTDVRAYAVTRILQGAPEPVRRGFAAFAGTIPEK